MVETHRAAKRPRKQYARLEPRVKNLNEATIRKKWKKLPINTQTKVADLLSTVERPIPTHGGNERRDMEVQSLVSRLVEELIHRLPRMPFPPGTDESSFDFESTINRQRILDEQLTADTHAIGLLEAEVSAETGFLQEEKAQLASLEKRLADLKASNEMNNRNLHPLAQSSSQNSHRESRLDLETRSSIKKSIPKLSDLDSDPEAQVVIDLLQHHLDGMKNKVESTQDIVTALSTSQAALDIFSWTHLGETKYRQIYRLNAT